MKPLDGVKVLEVASWVAAPSACAILADMGAVVVKVEPLHGDAMRGVSRQAKQKGKEHKLDHAFQVDNRGKKSIAIDLDSKDGAALVRRLAKDADIFVTNLLPKRQEKFGLDPTTLLGESPALVIGMISAYGNQGPESNRPGYDVTAFFGRGGVTDFATGADGVPPKAQPALGDHATGLGLVAGLLAALRNAEKTGKGDVVEVSLFGTALWAMAMDIAPALADGRAPTKRSRHEAITPLHNRYECGDGKWIFVIMPEVHWWGKFCNSVDKPEWAIDKRFNSPKARFKNMAAAVSLIDEVMKSKSLAEWAETFDRDGLIWGPIQSIADVVVDPQAHVTDRFVKVAHPTAGSFATVANPIGFRSSDTSPQRAAPDTGTDTFAVLEELGLTESEIDDLVRSDSIAGS